MKQIFFVAMLLSVLLSCSNQNVQTLTTIADARTHPAQLIDNGKPGDSIGDILVFDQPLLNKEMKPIGNNSGSCTRIRVAHSYQCQWTLTTEDGSILVGGREFDEGASTINIISGTGSYKGIKGEMKSTNNDNGTFTQVLRYRIVN